MNNIINSSFLRLKTYCEAEKYKGWDPYDGLNSKFFQSLPWIKDNKYFRLAWIQLFKRNPINFRKQLGVPKDYNPKGLALFLTGYCNLYNIDEDQAYLNKIIYLADKIIDLETKGYSGSCWGYNFDWQARAFFQPKYTPTVVATSFIADALLNAYDITKNENYKFKAISSASFVLKDLNKSFDKDGDFSFSYSPLDKVQVYNASLLGAKLLARVFSITNDIELKNQAEKAVRYVCKAQKKNGEWFYGTSTFHQWVDNFHTGYNIECIYRYQDYTKDTQFSSFILKGLDYYLKTFFTKKGESKYYNNCKYPVDVHAPAQLVVTLYMVKEFRNNINLIENILLWTIENMQSKKGYFHFQNKKYFKIKIPYMRWGQAWMFYALTYYLKSEYDKI